MTDKKMLELKVNGYELTYSSNFDFIITYNSSKLIIVVILIMVQLN